MGNSQLNTELKGVGSYAARLFVYHPQFRKSHIGFRFWILDFGFTEQGSTRILPDSSVAVIDRNWDQVNL
jgi:hypothetical protein